MGRKYGMSFSLKRATGISSAKAKFARATGIPTTRQGRQRKAGAAMGCLIPIVIVAGIFFLCACDNSSDTSQENRKQAQETHSIKTPIDVAISCSVEQNTGRVSIVGKTNLPLNTNLMFSIEEKSTHKCFGQTEGIVQADGSFKSELLGPLQGLQDGLYIASITMPVPAVQPENVQAIIGKNGEYLSGKLLKKAYGSVSITVEQDFSIGKKTLQSQQKRDIQRTADNIKIKKILCRQLTELLKFKDTKDFQSYGFGRGGKYYTWLESTTKIRDTISKNDDIDYDVRVAAGQILQVGMDYVNHPEGTSFTKTCLSEIKQAIDFKE